MNDKTEAALQQWMDSFEGRLVIDQHNLPMTGPQGPKFKRAVICGFLAGAAAQAAITREEIASIQREKSMMGLSKHFERLSQCERKEQP